MSTSTIISSIISCGKLHKINQHIISTLFDTIPHKIKCLFPKTNSILPWQTTFNTQRPIPHPRIRILPLPPNRLRTLAQIRLHLLPIQIRVISFHNPPLHQHRRRTGHERRGKRRARDRAVPAVPVRRENPNAGRCQIRFHIGIGSAAVNLFLIKIPSSGKIRIGLIPRVIRPHSDYFHCRGRYGQGHIRRRSDKTGVSTAYRAGGQLEGEISRDGTQGP